MTEIGSPRASSTPTVTSFATAATGLTQYLFGSASASNAFGANTTNGYYSSTYSDTSVATALPNPFGAVTASTAAMPMVSTKF